MKKAFTIRQEGHCDYCHTKLKSVGNYGVICPKCGPGADRPKHVPSDTQIAKPGQRCKFCGRDDANTCRSTVSIKSDSGTRAYVVWDARNCPMVKTRRGSKDSVGSSGGDCTWYIIPAPHERYERTGVVFTDKEVKGEPEEKNMALSGIDKPAGRKERRGTK